MKEVVRCVLLWVIMNGFLFPDPILSSFPLEAEETLLIDIASNSKYLFGVDFHSTNMYLKIHYM